MSVALKSFLSDREMSSSTEMLAQQVSAMLYLAVTSYSSIHCRALDVKLNMGERRVLAQHTYLLEFEGCRGLHLVFEGLRHEVLTMETGQTKDRCIEDENSFDALCSC